MANPRYIYICPTCGEAWHQSQGRYCPECRTEGEPATNDD